MTSKTDTTGLKFVVNRRGFDGLGASRQIYNQGDLRNVLCGMSAPKGFSNDCSSSDK